MPPIGQTNPAAPPRRRGPLHGLGKALKTAGDVGLGIGEGVVDSGKTVVSVVTHPRRTARGVGKLVTDPVDTLDALGSQPAKQPGGPQRSDARRAGRAIGKLGVDVLSMGGSTVARTADTIQDANRDAKRIERVSRAGRDGRPSDEPVRLGGVARGAASYVVDPLKDTVRAVAHPGRTAEGLREAARHPKQAVGAYKDEERELPTRSERVGRGAARLVGMSGLMPAPIDTLRDVGRTGQKVQRASEAGHATQP